MNTLRHFTSFARRTIESRTTQQVSDWVSNWCMDAQSVQVTVAEYFEEESSLTCFSFEERSGDKIAATIDTLDTKSLLFGTDATNVPDDDVCESVLQNAADDLLRKVVSAIRGKPSRGGLQRAPSQPMEAATFSARHCLSATQLKLSIILGDQTFTVVFPFRLAEGIAKPSESSRERVLSKLSIEDICGIVPARISLGFGKHSISDIYGLEVNDIIVSESSISAPLSVFVEGQEIAAAYLGKSNNTKSILLTK